jgi:hypothetical protein
MRKGFTTGQTIAIAVIVALAVAAGGAYASSRAPLKKKAPSAPSVQWALVGPAQTKILSQSGGIQIVYSKNSNVILKLKYTAANEPIIASNVAASNDDGLRGAPTVATCGTTASDFNCGAVSKAFDNPHYIVVETENSDGEPAPYAFYVAAFK